MSRYSIYPASFVGGATINLQQMHGVGVRPGPNEDTVIVGGALTPGAIILASAEPIVQLRTHDLVTAFGTMSATAGYNCSSGATFRLQKRADGSSFASGGSHLTLASSKGFLLPVSISASQQGPAELMLEYRAQSSNGIAVPLTGAYTVDLSGAPSPAFTSKFFLGPVFLSSAEVPGVLSAAVNFGIAFQAAPASGAVYPTEGSIVARAASATLTLQSLDVLNTVGSLWTKSLSSSLKIYFRKGASGADTGRVADASTVHAKATFATGVWSSEDISVSENADGTVSLNVKATGDLAFVVNSAIE